MLFNFKKKKDEERIYKHITFYFNPNELIVSFDEIFRMLRNYDVRVYEMKLYHNDIFRNGHEVCFWLDGTRKNINMFIDDLRNSDDDYLNRTFIFGC